MKVKRGCSVAGALVLSACLASPEEPVEVPPAAPGIATLATFVGEVDVEAGTVTIRGVPSVAASLQRSKGLQIIPEGADTVTIANTASWNRTVRAGRCGGVAVTGATVQVTSRYASPAFLGGAYAQIDEISAGTGVRACTGNLDATPPSGLSNTWGLFSYGSLRSGVGVSQEWDFVTGSATRFTFRGTIQAVKGGVNSALKAADSPHAIAYNGDDGAFGPSMVFADRRAVSPGLTFVNLDGTQAGTSAALAAVPTSIAVDTTNRRIWYTTAPVAAGDSPYIGYLSTDGTGVVEVPYQDDATGTLKSIVVNPANAAQAWFVDSAAGTVCSVTMGGGTLTENCPLVYGVGTVNAIAFGSDGRLYLAVSGNVIWAYDIGTATGTSYSTTASTCTGPVDVMRWNRAGKNVVFVAQTTGKVCEMSTGGVFATIGTTAALSGGYGAQATGEGTDADRTIWTTTSRFGTTNAANVVTGNPGYPVPLPLGTVAATTPFSVAASPAVSSPTAIPARIWVANAAGLYWIEP